MPQKGRAPSRAGELNQVESIAKTGKPFGYEEPMQEAPPPPSSRHSPMSRSAKREMADMQRRHARENQAKPPEPEAKPTPRRGTPKMSNE